MICLSRPYHFKFFKDCLRQILLGPFLNISSHIIVKLKQGCKFKTGQNILIQGFVSVTFRIWLALVENSCQLKWIPVPKYFYRSIKWISAVKRISVILT